MGSYTKLTITISFITAIVLSLWPSLHGSVCQSATIWHLSTLTKKKQQCIHKFSLTWVCLGDSKKGLCSIHKFRIMIICLHLSSPACPVGQFKSASEGQCTGCPGFSHAAIGGASVCACRSGYLRAESDTPDTPCTSKYTENRTYCRQNKHPLVCFLLSTFPCSASLLPPVSFSQTPLICFVSFVPLPGIEIHVFCDRCLGVGLASTPKLSRH